MDYRDLPYDAEIEYLKSTGTQWIDLGYTPNTNTVVQLGFQTHADSQEVILGYYNSSDQTDWRLFITRTQQCVHDLPSNARFGERVRGGNYTLTINEYHDWEIGNHYIKNLATEENILSGSRVTYTGEDTLKLNRVQKIDAYTKNSFYYIKIYEATTLVRDYIPVRVGNVGYLFDKVSKQLFGNSGTGSFVLGPDVAPGRYANEVAFLESWGNQYIDTGIKPSTDTKIELKCLYCKSGVGFTNYGALIGADDRANAYTLIHSDMANFTFGESVSKDFANPQTRLLTFDSTESSQSMKVYDEGGTLVTTLSCLKGIFEISQNLYLFAINRNGTPVYGSNRILYCKIYDGDTLVRDYVPVEYNGIGHMYDKVSGLFFGNQGTGKFLFGSIAKACARSYTRRQLMAKAPEEDWSKHYLTFKVLSAGTITVKASGSATGKTFQYSQDGGQTWLSITSTAEEQSLGDFTAGMNILVKSVNTTLGANNGANTFNGTARINLCGNIMSLLYGDSFAGKTSVSAHFAFMGLFKGNTGLISAKHLILPVTSHGTYGGNYLYGEMFQNCTSLISGPKELPLLTATSNCYASMFEGCISLESAPVIQLRTLTTYTGWYMFRNCHKLNYIKAMFTTAPVSGSVIRMREWVTGVATNGTFVKNSAATWDVRGVNGIPNNWIVQTADE